MKQFIVGNRVRSHHGKTNGMTGTVVFAEKDGVLIKFDNLVEGHNGMNAFFSDKNDCWWVPCRFCEKIVENTQK